jgi:ABC-type spermidine/putrescine transport system permease subunit II
LYWDLNHLYIKPETHLLFILLAIALFVLLPVIFYKKYSKNTNYFGLSTYSCSFDWAATLIANTDSYQQSNYSNDTTVLQTTTFISGSEKKKGSTTYDRY